MAAKAKAPVKAKKKPVAKVANKAKAKPKGLVLTSAQWAAYNKAFNASAKATATRLALAAATSRFRKYRLGSAYATMKQAQIATGKAQTAAIAAFAAKESWRQSRLAKQNLALRNRVEQNMFNHATIAGRLQFAQAGVKAYADRAIMRTVDTKQAMAYEEKVFAAIARTAKKGKKSTVKKGKRTSAVLSAAIKKQAAAAGLKAARSVKPTKASAKRGRPVGSTKGSAKASKAAVKKPAAKGSASAKAPVKAAKSRTALMPVIFRPRVFGGGDQWIHGNNEFAGTCIMTAVANAILHQCDLWLLDQDIAYWTGRAGPHPTIGGVLDMLRELQPWPEVTLLPPRPFSEFMIIGYEVETGDHAAFTFGDQMVSWGELVPYPDEVEEVWSCEFTRVAASPKT